jgi:hypothetical protein
MPYVNGIYQPADQRSPMERLYGFEEMQAKRQALQRQQAMQQQREQIMREAYQPAEEARTEYAFDQQPAPQQGGGLDNIMGALGIADAPQMQTKQVEAKPAQFDSESAIMRMYGAGDMDGAKGLSDMQRQQRQDASRWSGSTVYIEDPENPGVTIAAQPSTQGDGPAFRKLGVASVSPEAKIRSEQKAADLDLDREKISLDRQRFLFDQKKFYEGPEVQTRTDALQALQKQRESADSTFAVLDQIDPYLDQSSGSDLVRLARKGGTFLGFNSAAATADRMIDMGAATLTLTAPKLGGAASDRDVALYEQARGNLKSGTIEQKREAIKFIRGQLQKFGSADPGSALIRPSAALAPVAKTPASQPMPSLPDPAQHKGRTVRDTKSGVRYQSNGSQWMRVK